MIDTATYVPGSAKLFDCPNCGGTIAVRAVGISVTAVCESCKALVDVANENLQLIATAEGRIRKTLIPLGSRGELFGTEWEVIGFMERGVVEQAIYKWREYLLFNPWQGFRFLVENSGHWSFVTALRQTPDANVRQARYDGRLYKIFGTCNAKVLYVMGEFYWRVQIGDISFIQDYVAPPYVLSREETDQDVIWSHGVYVDHREIEQIFALQDELPHPSGVAPNQPNPAAMWQDRHKIFLVALIALVVLQFAFLVTSRNQTIIRRELITSPAQFNPTIVLGPLEVPASTGNIEVITSAPVHNHWLELNYDLVREGSQESFSLNQEVAYYTGYDSDGAWSEGSQTRSEVISAVPGGRYNLLISAASDLDRQGGLVGYSVRVKRDVPVWSNFWLAFFCLSLLPFIQWMRMRNFEKMRWAESDVSSVPLWSHQKTIGVDSMARSWLPESGGENENGSISLAEYLRRVEEDHE